MKGGITSGVVYPHAICELARTYRFVDVGGTSAGAIAAAAAAAAEHGRERDGFRKLAALPAWIGEGDNLFRLFQPQPGDPRRTSGSSPQAWATRAPPAGCGSAWRRSRAFH